METLKKIWKVITSVITAIFIGAISLFIYKKKNEKQSNIEKKAEEKKEEVRRELEEKSADDIAANSPNADIISSNITKEQDEFRQRIRDRLNKKL